MKVTWTGIVGAIAVGALGIYTLRSASSLAKEEQEVFHTPIRFRRFRAWNLRLGGVFLLAVAVALALAGAR